MQVRCRAEGVSLRASVTQNGTRTCSHAPKIDINGFHYLTFWMYLIFRTVGEIAVIGAILLLRVVTLNDDARKDQPLIGTQSAHFRVPSPLIHRYPCRHVGSVVSVVYYQRHRALRMWWIWALLGLVLLGPLAGFVSDLAGFGIGFLLGSVMFGLASLMIALSPNPQPAAATGAGAAGAGAGVVHFSDSSQENQLMVFDLSPPATVVDHQQPQLHQRLSCADLRQILSHAPVLLIAALILFFGMMAAVVSTSLHW